MPALTALSSWNLDSTSFPPISLSQAELGITTDGTNVFAFDNQHIRKFSPTGTYDSTADVTYSDPPTPSSVPDTHDWSFTSDIAYYNNSWYLLVRYQNYFYLQSGVTFWYSLHRYNTSFVHQETLWTIGPIRAFYRDMKVDGTNAYLVNHSEQIITRRLSDGRLTAAFPTGSDPNATGDTAIAVTPTRFYVVNDTSIRAFDRSGNRVTADDTTLTGVHNNRFPNGGGLIGDTFYFGGSTSSSMRTLTVFRYSGVSTSTPSYTARWRAITYYPTDRILRDVIELSEDPGSAFSASTDFKVQVRSGSAGSYTWADSSGWGISGDASGTSRGITATAATTVPEGFYRIVLKQDAFGTGKPSADVFAPAQSIIAYSATSTYSARWETAVADSTTREISAQMNLSEDPGSALSATDDFVVRVVTARTTSPPSVTTTVSSGWTFSVTGTGTTRNVVAAPASTVPAGEYQLEIKENAFGTGKPDSNVTSSFVNIGAYVAPPVQTRFAYWSSPSHNINTRELSAVLNMAEDPGAAFDASQDFEVQMFGASVWATSSGWTFASTGSGTTRTITATPTGSIQYGRYRMVLKEDAFGTDKPEAPLPSTAVMVQSTTTPTTPITPTPRTPARTGAELANQTEAGAFLMEVDLTTNQCRVIKRWAYITIAARSLEVHDGEVYWFEGSHYGNRRRRAVVGTTPDADGSIPVRYPETLGNVFSVKPGTRDITDHGINWRSQFDYPADDVVVPDYGFHTQTASPMRSDGENLYLISGFGGLQGITSIQYATSRRGPVGVDVVTDIGNWQLLKYSEDLDRRIWLFNGNGMKGWEAIRVLASLTQSFIGIDRHGLFYFTSKGGIHAEVQSSAPGSIEFRNPTDIFPQQGLIEINNEIIGYSGIIGRQFLNIARAQYGTSSASHATGSTIRLIKTVLNTSQSVFDPIDESDIRSNTSQLFNKIVVSYDNENEYEYQDDASIRRYGERIYEMTLPLNELQTAWIEDVARRFIDAHKDVHHLITLRMHEDFDIEVTDVVFLQIPERSQFNHACQVYQVTQNPTNRETELILRTL